MRLEKIDILRGIAIILMVLFHFNYILLNVFNISFINFNGIFWFLLGKIAGILFIFIAGFSFYLSYEKYKKDIYKKYFRVIINLIFLSVFISLFTYFFIPEQIILFGILHFFALSFALLLILHRFGYYNLIILFLIFISLFYFPIEIENKYLFPFGFIYKGFYSADYYPIIPNFFYILFGFLCAKYLRDINFLNIFSLKNKNFLSKILIFLGQKSLLIYVIHVPIIYVIIYIWLKIFN